MTNLRDIARTVSSMTSVYEGYTGHRVRADLERAQFDGLQERLSREQDENTFLGNARAVCRFLNEEPNPAYGDTLVTLVLGRALLVVRDLQTAPPTYASMMVERVTTKALQTDSLWQGILNNNASTHRE